MKSITRRLGIAFSLISLISLTGCGEEETTPFSANRTITTADAESIALSVLDFTEIAEGYQTTDSNTGLRVNGADSRAVTTSTGDPVACFAGGTTTFSVGFDTTAGTASFTITSDNCDNGLTVTDGFMTFSGSETGTVATTNFTFDLTVDGLTNSGSMVATRDSSNNAYTFDLNMNFNSPEGGLTIVTNTVFVGVGFDRPTAGQMTITGAENASIRLTAMDSSVKVEVDEDGDGAYEVSVTKSWIELGTTPN